MSVGDGAAWGVQNCGYSWASRPPLSHDSLLPGDEDKRGGTVATLLSVSPLLLLFSSTRFDLRGS